MDGVNMYIVPKIEVTSRCDKGFNEKEEYLTIN